MRRPRAKWVEMFFGILLVILGILTLIIPADVLGGLTICYAVMAIITGARDLMFYCKSERYTGFAPCVSLITGIISIMSGIMLIAYPSAGVYILSLLFPLWLISHSIFQLISADIISLFSTERSGRIARISGIIGLILGFILLIRPGVSKLITAVILSAFMIITGITSILIAKEME